jgi:uncharacterized delta-60 repeat protein
MRIPRIHTIHLGAKHYVLSLALLAGLLLWPAAAAFPATPRPWEGTLDTSFDPGAGADGEVDAIAVQPNGKIIIAGDFTSYRGVSRNSIARINADGTLDSTFDPGTGTGPDHRLYAIALQDDGKILIGGSFASYNETPRNGIARVNADGTLDTSFDPGTGVTGNVLAIALQNGKILIGGDFDSYNGTTRNYVARLDENGSLDTTFNPGTGPNDRVHSLACLPGDKVMIGGYFTEVDGTTLYHIARLNADGTLDGSFDSSDQLQGYYAITYSIAPLADGKVLAGGNFTYNYGDGVDRAGIARLNANGTLDTSFNPGEGADGVNAILRDGSGKILLGGSFQSLDQVGRNGLGRLLANGPVDLDFDPGTGATDLDAAPEFVTAMALQSDGKVLIGGMFAAYDGTARNRIARVNAYNLAYHVYLPSTFR